MTGVSWRPPPPALAGWASRSLEGGGRWGGGATERLGGGGRADGGEAAPGQGHG